MLSVPVQLIVSEDHSRNGSLCVERVVKQLLTHALLCAQISDVLEFLFILTLIFVHFCLQCSDTVGWGWASGRTSGLWKTERWTHVNWLPSWYGIKIVAKFLCCCIIGYLYGMRYKWFAYSPADATTTPSSVASLKSRLV